MGNFPLMGFGSRAVYYPTSLSTDWIDVKAAISQADTMGDWVEMIPATPFDCILHWQRRDTSTTHWYASEIGIGAEDSEQTIVEPVILAGYNTYDIDSIVLPIMIPAGTRVAMRSQCSASTANPYNYHCMGCIDVSGFKGTRRWGSFVDSLGYDSGITQGVYVDPGATANYKGAWAEIIDATDYDYMGFFLSSSNDESNSTSNVYWNIDVAVGSAGNEKAILEDWYRSRQSGSYLTKPNNSPNFPIKIPEGSRLSMRMASNNNQAAYRTLDYVIHGIR